MLLSIYFYLFILVYSLLSNSYYPKSIEFNIFQVGRELSRFHQFGAYFVSDAKHWHHAFDFL